MINSYHIHMIIYNVALLIYTITSILSFLFLMSYMAIVAVTNSDIYVPNPENIDIEGYLTIATMNNDMDYLLRIFIPTICIIILVKIFQRLSLTKPKSIPPNRGRENKYQKYIDDIKIIVSKYTKKNYNIQVTHETALVGDTITLSTKSFNDLIEEKKDNFLFLLNHEFYHSKIFDNSIGYLYNIFFQILKIIISIVYLFIIGSFVANYYSSNNVEYWFVKDLLVYIFVYFLFIFIYKIISKTFVYIQYFKECLCDRYASLILKRDSLNNKSVFDNLLDKKENEKHPKIKQRKQCVEGKILFGENIVYLIMGIFVLAYFPFQDVEVYRNIVVYISIVTVTVLLSLNLYISNDKKVYKHSVVAIIFGGILLYIKSRLYYIWLYGSLTVVNDIEYGMNIGLDNTLTHILFIAFISLISLSIIRSIKYYE